jgi:hypothetical protein
MDIGTSKIRWCWIIGSSAALALGAAIALVLYPEARFGRNPVGQFGWYLVGFALCVGLPLALLQCLLLALALQHYSFTRFLGLLLWIPVTSGGIAAMILPLWSLAPAPLLMIVPFIPLLVMLPGMVALGLAQWLILRWLFDIKPLWITYTIIGAIIGAVIGLMVATVMASVLPLEVMWAGVAGTAMSVLQARVLVGAASDGKQGLIKERMWWGMRQEETAPSRPSMRSFVYGFYLVLGVIVLFAVLVGYLNGNALGLLGICYLLLAPAVAVFTIIALSGGVDWKLVVLLVSTVIFTLIFFGIEYFGLGNIVLGVSNVCYAILTLALSIWHFLDERATFKELLKKRAAEKIDTHQ